MEVEASGQNSINLLESWRHHVSLGCHDDCAVPAALGLAIGGGDLKQVPRCPASDPLLEELLKDVSCKVARDASDPTKKSTPPKQCLLQILKKQLSHRTTCSSSKFTFTISDSKSHPISMQAKAGLSLCRGIKRRRCLLDVDGFNTAGLSSKKRRLRFELITSRLSQPYSQPATHILNREGQESGDKRFLKMATTLDSARRATHLHATSFLRYSTMNCLKKRLNLAHPGAVARRDDQEAVAVVTKANKAAWRMQSLQASSEGKSLRLSPSPNGGMGIMPTTPSLPPQIAPTRHNYQFVKPQPHACRLSSPAALPRPATDLAASKKRTSPRIHPVQSPELRPSSPLQQLDDLEEDSFAFLHPPVDDEYDWDDSGGGIGDDDQEDSVYSDFSVVFGQDSPATADEASDERSYEEYLDELDGICWVSR
ncbi:hypothetical protein B0T10DRAFT_294210 [Thelonectria olida]|uniref:Uncharacterized protein n=1 Tax=Thelonectria olida TaxID=1576542 RepID=A0A9P9ARP2_9HYPO|nr:hypothetical protein B0T10DRAFT_294210 [Thelonectria olida]